VLPYVARLGRGEEESVTTNVIIVGGGKVGAYLAAFLSKHDCRIQLIEVRREEIARLETELKHPNLRVWLGSGTDPAVLEAAGIRQTSVIAAVTGDDEVNLVVTSLARFEFHVPRTIVRVNNPKNAWLHTAAMGVDVSLNQADVMAHMIAEEIPSITS
jgi:trk system potassium uptake protein TrkA